MRVVPTPAAPAPAGGAAVANGDDRSLVPVERWFLYMPFVHAEDPATVDGVVRTIATGFHYCNGIALEPDGTIVVVDEQDHEVGGCQLAGVTRDARHGRVEVLERLLRDDRRHLGAEPACEVVLVHDQALARLSHRREKAERRRYDADHGNGATENLRRECRADERSQPAIRHAEDRDLVLLRDPFTDSPIDHVDQVVMHLAGVLFFARRDEGFAEPGRATVIDREHGIAPIGQPLMIAPIAEDITRPRTSMHDQYHRQRLGRAITFDVGRQGQI